MQRSGSDETTDSLVMFRAAVECAFDAVLITDAALDPPGPRILYVNPAFTEMTGYPAEEILGCTPRILQGPDTDRAVLDRLRGALERGERFEGQTVNYRRDGTAFDLEWRTAPMRDAHGTIRRFVSVQRDVTAENRLLQRLRYAADFDALTGTHSRAAIERQLGAEIQRARRHGLDLGVILLDLDRFKRINDEHGHPVGDRVLQRVVQRIQARLRASDLFGRWGGEEFLVALPHTEAEGARTVADTLLEAIRSTAFPGGVQVTLSVGVTTLRTDDDVESVVHRADRMLYAAKERGRDTFAAA